MPETKFPDSATNSNNGSAMSAYSTQYTGSPALFCQVIETLQQENHQLCILHGYKHYPEGICATSDIDAISEAPDQVPHILASRGTAKVVQVLQHEATAFSYTLYRDDEGKPALILLDVSLDYRRNGRVFFTGEEFLQARKSFKFFQIPATELEFAYYVIKKIAKADLQKAHEQRLSELYREAPERCRAQLKRFFPAAGAALIAEAGQNRDWQSVRDQIPDLRQSLLNKVRKANLLNVCGYWVSEVRRLVKRILQPTGLMIVVLGADGSGKSTVITRVRKDLAPAFRQTHYIHLRPRLGKTTGQDEAPVLDPHGQPPRSWLTSVIKLIYFVLDYGVGYLIKVYPKLVRSTFVIFDRYYHDLLVDSRRYRYGGPRWWAKLVGRLIPKPDLWILLDAPAEVLQARKQEVSFEETARQRKAYLELVNNLPNAIVVNSAQPLDDVVLDVAKAVLVHMAKRTQRRLGL
ncbi:MAG: hypothetical protein AAF959_03170 [Cyanobacteria bacterium P01_D01_bin.56]